MPPITKKCPQPLNSHHFAAEALISRIEHSINSKFSHITALLSFMKHPNGNPAPETSFVRGSGPQTKPNQPKTDARPDAGNSAHRLSTHDSCPRPALAPALVSARPKPANAGTPVASNLACWRICLSYRGESAWTQPDILCT